MAFVDARIDGFEELRAGAGPQIWLQTMALARVATLACIAAALADNAEPRKWTWSEITEHEDCLVVIYNEAILRCPFSARVRCGTTMSV